jgi:Beta-lactamase enzyme family/Putative peptidoglycan binding domain
MVQTGSRRRLGFPILEVAGLLFIVAAIILFVTSLAGFTGSRQKLPPGMVIGSVPVGNLSRAEAQAYIERVYGAPITVRYRDQELRLSPDQIGLNVDSEAMITRATTITTEGTFWSGFWDFLWGRPGSAYHVDLVATYSQDALRAWVQDVAARYDRPPQPARPVLETLSFAPGQPGSVMDQEASLKVIDAALRRPDNRQVDLPIKNESSPEPDLDTFKAEVIQYLQSKQFNGVTMVHAIDTNSGKELNFGVDMRQGQPAELNCEVAIAGQSAMKIAIMADFYRHVGIPEPGSDDEKILHQTMIESGDITANFMLQVIGQGDANEGARDVTAMMQNLGMQNSFMAVPYGDKTPPQNVTYYATPAREAARNGTCVNTNPDYAMQTTASDLAIIMQMIYQCADLGGGGLLAAYPTELSQAACQDMVNLMEQNPDGIIMAGLPKAVKVAHKHGWGSVDTIADSAIVYSPGRTYILAYALWVPNASWVDPNRTFPLLAEVSQAMFNFYNPDMLNVARQGFNPALRIQPIQ